VWAVKGNRHRIQTAKEGGHRSTTHPSNGLSGRHLAQKGVW